MPVAVVHVRAVLVVVLDRVVAVQVRVLSHDGPLVQVIVVAIVVAMRMLVLDRLVQVAMSVALGQVQVDADSKESRRQSVSAFAGCAPTSQDSAAPTNGASAKIEAVRAAPIRRCASKVQRRLNP